MQAEDTRSSAGSPDPESSGRFVCFLCEAGGFTASGMEQHLWQYHKDDAGEGEVSSHSGALCGDSTACDRDLSHVDGKHTGESSSHISVSDDEDCSMQGHSPPAVAETSSVVDGVDVGPDVLETSLRLSDCPAVDNLTEQYDLTDDFNNEDDLADTIDDVVNGNRDVSEQETPVNDPASDLEEDSNLPVILGIIQNGDNLQRLKSENSRSASNVSSINHGGARPKHKPCPSTVTQPTEPQASASYVDDEERGDRVFTCPFCSFCTASEGEIHRHVNQEHMMEGEEEAMQASADVLFLYSCPFCACSCDTPKDLSQHINTQHPDGQTDAGTSSQEWPQSAIAMADPNCCQAEGRETVSTLQCPVCGLILKGSNELTLSLHVNKHFASSAGSSTPQVNTDQDHQMALELQKEEEQQQQKQNKTFQNIQTQYGMDSSMTAQQQFDRDLEEAATKGRISTAAFYEKKNTRTQSSHSGVDDGSTQVSGLMEKLQQFYSSKSCPHTVTRAHLCSPMHHYSGTYGDKGWGCGYRNLQMLLSCLMNDPTYLQVLFRGKAKIPSIGKLQQLIEAAWKKGFDSQGCQQLGGTLVNSRKWIGATEIVAMLSSFRIKCQVLDFVKPSGPNNTHPVLIQWVRDYFTSGAPFRPPLYLQHQGHSRTIVGVEELANGNTNLLLFDPGVPQQRMEQFHGRINYNLLQTIRKTISAFRACQYQIVAVVGVLNERELERSKFIQSKRMS